MHEPLISIVMPAFNAERTICTALQSVLSQTYKHYELLVCDDGSTDQTASIICSCNRPNIKRFHNAVNRGQGFSRDKAIRAAKGEMVAFIDADDAWCPNRLEVLVNAMDDRKNNMVFDNIMQCHDVDGELVPWKPLRKKSAWGVSEGECKGVQIADLVRDRRLLMQPLLPIEVIRKQGILHRGRGFGEDAEFLLNCLAAGLGVVYVPQPLYFYRITSGSASSDGRGALVMRHRLKRCRLMFSEDPEIQVAFDAKIEQLRRIAVRMLFLRALRVGRLWQAFRIAVANPVGMMEIPLRIPGLVAYHVSRIRSGASRRGLE